MVLEEILENAKKSLEKHFGSKKTALMLWLNGTYLVLCPAFLIFEKAATGEYVHGAGIGYIYVFVALVQLFSLCFNVYQLKNYKIGMKISDLKRKNLLQFETIMTYTSLFSLMVVSFANMLGYGNPSHDSILVDFAIANSIIILISILVNRFAAIGWTLISITCLFYVSFSHGLNYQFDYLTPDESIKYHALLEKNDPIALTRRDTLSANQLNSPKVSRYLLEWLIVFFITIVTAYYFNGKTSKMFEIFPKVTDDLEKAQLFANEQDREKLKFIQRNAKLNEELLKSEINFLKAQINPHFIFNSLNNLYGKLLDRDPDSANLSLKIAEMMRYSVDSTTSEIVFLTMELDAIQVFLDLQKARFEEDYNVFFSLNAPKNDYKIPPLILLTLIENSFKYGVTNQVEEPIKIFIKIIENRLLFECSNLVSAKSIEKSTSSIGIQNIKKRLERFNSGDYTLDHQEIDGRFMVKLEMGLVE